MKKLEQITKVLLNKTIKPPEIISKGVFLYLNSPANIIEVQLIDTTALPLYHSDIYQQDI